MKLPLGTLLAGVLVILAAIAPASQATDGPAPTQLDGNPVCPAGDLALDVERGSEATLAGTYDGPGGVRVTVAGVDAAAHTFSFTATGPVHEVIAKGGPTANLYTYSGGATSGTNLHPPVNPNGSGGARYYGISHITFCFSPGSSPPAPVERPARIVIDEVTLPGHATQSFAFTPSAGTPFSLTDDQAPVSRAVPAGTYTVHQGDVGGWPVAALRCDDADSTVDLAAATATLVVAPGETVTCVFVNVQRPEHPGGPPGDVPPTPWTPGTTPPATTPVGGAGVPPHTAAGGATISTASATLRGPQACVRAGYALGIRGRAVARIVVTVNGRRVATVAGRTGTRTYRVRVPIVGPGPQRVAARVLFRSGTSPRARTLRTTAFRCAPRVVRPQFTG